MLDINFKAPFLCIGVLLIQFALKLLLVAPPPGAPIIAVVITARVGSSSWRSPPSIVRSQLAEQNCLLGTRRVA